MKISIDSINSAEIRFAMWRDRYTTAELLGTFQHPKNDGNDWLVRLFYAADALVFETNGDPVWQGTSAFDALVAEYGIDIEAATRS
jgi:hypothetical protein